MLGSYKNKNTKFSRIPRVEETKNLISDPESAEELDTSLRIRASRWPVALLSIVALTMATLFGAWLGSRPFGNPDIFCTKRTAKHSPVLKDVDISYETVTFNGSLLKENVFRQDAGPEVDAAWTSLGVDSRSFLPIKRKVQVFPLLMSKCLKSTAEAIPANVEGLHHLHCLNLLRQSLYYNFDYYHKRGEGAFVNNDAILRFHVSHCLDILRQQLMCTVDIGVLGQVWWNKDEPTAYPDFNTEHRCRNFDVVRQWAEAHQAPDEVPLDYLKPPMDLDHVYAEIP
ncbi:hypothetical protein B0A49_11075 [Cryomyces minteri]|uniref:Tat pathway signal sequence n=1 Tax=Cryomyces minteri TaxID=331657 RepID=A0A4U0VM18_9PEZI|nr:hypothetical protein B0A49_11075 [Cryomyces minteri]